MARLIDGDALKSYIDCGHLRSPIETCFSELDVVRMLDKQPTIDAVPVVRCKDCVAVSVYNDKLICSRISDVIDGYYHGTVEVVKPDDYCSKGIRRIGAKMDGGEEDASNT